MREIKALIGGKVIDGTGAPPVDRGVVVIGEDGKISAWGSAEKTSVSPEAEVIDCSGKTVVPGLIDSHVHLCFKPCADPFAVLAGERDGRTALRGAENARKTLLSGVTAVRDMGGKNYVDLDLRDTIAGGEVQGPCMLASGRLLTMTGGHGWPEGEEVDGADQARKGARKQLKEGVNLVKVMATGGVMTEGVEPGSPQLTEEEIRAAVEEAHKADRKVAAHAQGLEGIKNSLRAGVDSIEHGVFLDEEAVNLIKEKGVFLVPTLAAPYWISREGREAGIPEYMVEKANAVREAQGNSFRLALRAGVNIAMGTDAGTPFNYHGRNAFELSLMVEEGMEPLEAIQAATLKGAELMGIDERKGSIAPGKDADLLILEGDPLQDITAVERTSRIFLQGFPL